jgi:hypothetical protein
MNANAIEGEDAPAEPGLRRLMETWLLVGLVDGAWAVVLTLTYQRSVIGLFQGIAVTAFGPTMEDGGAPAALLGLGVHFGVALFWSAVFLMLVRGSTRLREAIATPPGMFVVAACYGPLIWIVMSGAVIPTVAGTPLAVTGRWWIQLVGHVFFVGLPIVWGIGRRPASPAHALAH